MPSEPRPKFQPWPDAEQLESLANSFTSFGSGKYGAAAVNPFIAPDRCNPKFVRWLYERGFAGAVAESDASRESRQRLAKERSGFTTVSQAAHAFKFADSGAGQLVIPWVWQLILFPGSEPGAAQERGDCWLSGTSVLGEKTQPIERVQVGDMVWTGEGRLSRVISRRELRTVRPIARIKSRGMIPLECTADHTMLVYRVPKCRRGRLVNAHRVAAMRSGADRPRGTDALLEQFETLEPQWVPAGDLQPGDALLTPIHFERLPVPHDSPFNIAATSGGQWLCGAFAGNGWTGGEGQIEITTKHEAIAKNAADEMNYLGLSASTKFRKGAWRVRCRNAELSAWLRSTFYDDSKAKQAPGWCVGSVPFLVGMRDSDGFDKDGVHFLDSTSKSLLLTCYATLVDAGFDPTISLLIRSRGTYANAKPLYRMIWRDSKAKHYIWRDERYLCRPVVGVDIIEGESVVYDIGIEDAHHSFLADGIATHNCVSHASSGAQRLSMTCDIIAGKPDEKSGLIEGVPDVDPVGIKEGITSSEWCYWWRGYNGDGWSCGTAAEVAMRHGVALRNNYADLGIDLRNYSGALAGKYGSRAPSEQLDAAFKVHPVHSVLDANSFEETRDALANGFAVQSCGGEGFSSKRDQWGYSPRSGSWSHGYKNPGADDRDVVKRLYGQPLLLNFNNWGTWNSGGRDIIDSARFVPQLRALAKALAPWQTQTLEQLDIVNPQTGNIMIPPGAWWCKWSEAKNRDFHVYAGVGGWKRRALPNWGGSLAG